LFFFVGRRFFLRAHRSFSIVSIDGGFDILFRLVNGITLSVIQVRNVFDGFASFVPNSFAGHADHHQSPPLLHSIVRRVVYSRVFADYFFVYSRFFLPSLGGTSFLLSPPVLKLLRRIFASKLLRRIVFVFRRLLFVVVFRKRFLRLSREITADIKP